MTKKQPRKNIPPPISRPSPPPSPSPYTPSSFSNVASTVIEGISFGAGSSIGHRVIDSIFNSSMKNDAKETKEPKQAVGHCEKEINMFKECVKNADTNNCDFYYNIIKQCEEKHV